MSAGRGSGLRLQRELSQKSVWKREAIQNPPISSAMERGGKKPETHAPLIKDPARYKARLETGSARAQLPGVSCCTRLLHDA